MFEAVFRREFAQRIRHPLVLGGAVLLGLAAFNDLTITSPTASGLIRIGQLPHDAPLVLTQLLTVLGVVGSLLVALVMAPAVRQDFDHRSYPLVFTTGVGKLEYLGGRFLGAFTASGILMVGALTGMIVGLLTIGPEFRSGTGLLHWGVAAAFVLPHVLLVASVFFAIGALTRSAVTTYVGAVISTVLFFLVQGILADLLRTGMVTGGLTSRLLALADPSGTAALELVTLGWTVAEQSRQALPIDAYLVGHRIFWALAAGGIFLFTVRRFRLLHPLAASKSRSRDREVVSEARPVSLGALRASRSFRGVVRFRQLARLTGLELSRTFRHLAFLVLAGLMLVQFHSNFYQNVLSRGLQPRTGFLLNEGLTGIGDPIVLLTLFFAGVLVWRERDTGEAPLTDVLPVPDWTQIGAKLSALVGMQLGYALLVVVSALVVQVGIFGYTRIEPGVYLAGFFGVHVVSWIQIAVGAFFLHALSPNRYVGFGLTGLVLAWSVAAPSLGIDHPVLRYAAMPEYTYSDMNAFGPFAGPLVLHQTLWTGGALALAVGAVLLWPRGVIPRWTTRLDVARKRWSPAAAATIGAGLLLLAGSWALIGHGAETEPDAVALLAAYEARHQAREQDPQPRTTAVNLQVDLYPADRSAVLRGAYGLRNETSDDVRELHVTLLPTRGAQRRNLDLDRPARREVDPVTGFTTFTLRDPLRPGEEVDLRFELDFEPGAGGGAATALVENGTILHNFVGEAGFFPLIGYRREFELQDPSVRERHGLEPEATTLRRIDAPDVAMRTSREWVRLEAVVSTDRDQVAVAPGRLVARRTEGERTVFHFRADTLMANEFAIVSGRYDLAHDTVGGVAVEVLYHPEHEANVPRILRGVARGLEYGIEQFGPYPYGVLRVVEVPAYGMVDGTAVSKPGLVVWNETGGFVSRPALAGEVDAVFSTAVHEVAHQWWGHQVRPAAFAEGGITLVETLAQHVRLAGLRSEFGEEAVTEFLADERMEYLRARNRAGTPERPLATTRDAYVAYHKGSLAMNSLSGQLGTEPLNAALRTLVGRFALAGPPYATTSDLVDALRSAAPDSLEYLVEDWFETLTFHEAGVESVVVTPGEGPVWRVTAEISFAKIRSDGTGDERPVPPGDWIDVGVRGEGGATLAVERQFVDSSRATFTFEVRAPPASVVVDPGYRLLERDRADNTALVRATLPEPDGRKGRSPG